MHIYNRTYLRTCRFRHLPLQVFNRLRLFFKDMFVCVGVCLFPTPPPVGVNL